MCVGNITDTVMKTGDDLRQDQIILGMLHLFNTIWKREGVVHVLAGSGVVPGAFYVSIYVSSIDSILDHLILENCL